MWDYESYMRKARTYFERAQEHPKLDDAILAIWLLLGLEFLLRAPLAKISPTLLAEPDFVMDAAGFPSGTEPRSIATKVVVGRLQRVVDNFTPQAVADANFLIGIRNKELHSGSDAVGLNSATWLPRFIRVADVICAHLSVRTEHLIGHELTAQGRALVADQDQKIASDVRKRILACQAHFSQLRSAEIEKRRLDIPDPMGGQESLFPDLFPTPTFEAYVGWREIVDETGHDPEFVPCPSCAERVPIRLMSVRSTNERLEGDSIIRQTAFVGTGMACVICGLKLANTAELSAAGLSQQYIREEESTLEEWFSGHFDMDD